MASRTNTAALLLLGLGLPTTTMAIDNGLGLLPPMGWRSWNCYHGDVTQDLLEGVMDAMVNKSRTVDGKPTSLLDLGYVNCGLDDNWQACGAGPLKGFHDKDGNPMVNTKTFPNMSAMTDYGHQRGLRVGWYALLLCLTPHRLFYSYVLVVTRLLEMLRHSPYLRQSLKLMH